MELSWEPYSGYLNGVDSYTIEKYDGEGNLLTTFSTTDTRFTDNTDNFTRQELMYRVLAVPAEAGLPVSTSQPRRIIRKAILGRPQAFTPNGDGLNDTFMISGTFITEYNIRIYNRWGQIIFTSADMNEGWDGTFAGRLLPSGSYAYTLDLVDAAGRDWSVTGFVALIRN